MADAQFCLIQHQTKLYLVDICALLVELVKQQTIFKFGKLDRVELQPPAPIEECLVLALRESEPETSLETERDYGQIAKVSKGQHGSREMHILCLLVKSNLEES